MKELLRPSFSILLVFTAMLGPVYPLLVTGFAQLVFPMQANGSVIIVNYKPIGSALIGQNFTLPKDFWSRPSATTPIAYNATASAGSNLGPLNPELRKAVTARVHALRATDPNNRLPIPIDLVTSSGSGLDPHISPEAAYYQVPRVARARGLSQEYVRRIVEGHIEPRFLGFFGEPRVNVLQLNVAMNKLEKLGGT
jgi:potassium-transporting ATPase KdpC subunit